MDFQEIDEESRIRQEVEQHNYDRHLNDIRHLLKLPEGRRYIWDVLSSCGVMSKSMCPNMYDTAFREGQRNIGLAMMQDIMEARPEAYDQMRRENASNMKSDEALIQNKLKELEV